MVKYNQEKENVIDVVSKAVKGYVSTSSSEKIVHYVEIEFEKENGFSIDDCYKIRLGLEDRFEDRFVDVDFSDEGKLKVMVEFSVLENDVSFDDIDKNNPFSDELFVDAARLVVQNNNASTAFLQKSFEIGYAKAGRLKDQMIELGLISSWENGNEVLVTIQELETKIKSYNK